MHARRPRDSNTSLQRWRFARRMTLGSIVLAGSVATSAAVMYRMATTPCGSQNVVNRTYTYSGIGIVIEADQGQVVVRRVVPGSPAEGKLVPGARLVSLDGEYPNSTEAWAAAIRGEPGTSFELEVAYPCQGHKRVFLVRDVVRVAY